MKRVVAFLLFVFLFSFAVVAQEGITPNSEIEKVKVFPNPATHVVNVLGLKNSDRADISITDLYGNKIISLQWEIKNNALNIPIVDLEPGIYVISIQTSEQRARIKFFKE